MLQWVDVDVFVKNKISWFSKGSRSIILGMDGIVSMAWRKTAVIHC